MAHVGFLGLGSMGRPMAEALIAAGHHVTVWMRSDARAAPLADQGARLAAAPRDVVAKDGLVLSMLADDAAVADVCYQERGLLSRLAGGLHVSLSTISPAAARQLAEDHEDVGATYLAAPVFGRPDMARAGKLFVCLSGPDAAKARARPVLEAFAQGFHDFGTEDVGAANVVKLAGNFMLAAAFEAMGEAYTFAEKNGVDRAQLNAMLTETLFAAPAYTNYGGQIARHSYTPAGFKLSLGLKDLRLVHDAADAAQVPMPLADLLYRRLLSMTAKGEGGLDWAGIGRAASDDAGTSGRS